MRTEITAEMVSAKYVDNPQTDKDLGNCWLALRREMLVQRFLDRTGLKREEVTLITNSRTGKVFPQWIGAVPKEMETR